MEFNFSWYVWIIIFLISLFFLWMVFRFIKIKLYKGLGLHILKEQRELREAAAVEEKEERLEKLKEIAEKTEKRLEKLKEKVKNEQI